MEMDPEGIYKLSKLDIPLKKSQAPRKSGGDNMNLHVIKGHVTVSQCQINIRSERQYSMQCRHTAGPMSICIPHMPCNYTM